MPLHSNPAFDTSRSLLHAPLWRSTQQLWPVVLLMGAVMLAVSGSVNGVAGDTTMGPPNPLPCTCTDVDARVEYDSVVEYRCWEQYKFGQCDMPFMKDTVKELPEGYCEITCGRCSCCPTLAQAARNKGLSLFAEAAKAVNLTDVDAPGWEVALFAPDNAAMQAGLQRLGFSLDTLKSDKDAQQVVREVLKFHAVPAVPHLHAVYTSAFLEDGQTLPTMMSNDTSLTVSKGAGGFFIKAPKSEARVKQADIYACKGVLYVIDAVLLPWDSNHYWKVGTSDLPVDCNPHGNAEYTGGRAATGSTSKKSSANDCCYTCKKTTGCNTWVFCPRAGGCKTVSGELDEQGTCHLKFQESVAQGSYAQAAQEGILVSHISGAIRDK